MAKGRASPRQRIRAWFENRLPRTDSLTLTQGNIYIVPTRAGFAFALTLVLMLLASINYQLNLGYLLTFLLAGSALVSMHLTHSTLRGLELRARAPVPVFVGDTALIDVTLSAQASKRTRHGIGLALRESQPRAWAWVDVPAGGASSAQIGFVPERRGANPLPTLIAETRFPLGLFRAWTVWRPAAQALAWPRPEQPAPPLPGAEPVPGAAQVASTGDGGEFDGVRAYRRGDALRRVVWKKAARTGDLVSRDSAESASRELWLDFDATLLPDPEARLARLAAWTLVAERRGLAFGLRLPRQPVLPPATGDAQRRAALDALARWTPQGAAR